MDSYLERLQQAIASATRGMSNEDLTRQSGREVECGGSARTSLSDLHGNLEGLRTLPAGREAVGQRPHFQAESGIAAGH